jgi:hypothetical protein
MTGSQIICIILIAAATIISGMLIKAIASYRMKKMEWEKQEKIEKAKSGYSDTAAKIRNDHELVLMGKKHNQEMEILKFNQSS